MDFDLTTFAFEVLNFLVLVWLLKRFFYQPVLAVIEARRAANAKTLADAEVVRGEAEALKNKYQAHLAAVDEERALAKSGLATEIADQRRQRLTALEGEIAEERKRRETLAAREKSELERTLEQQAIAIAGRFSARLLERLASPGLEEKLVDLALNDFKTQTPEQLETLRLTLNKAGVTIKVVSAYPLASRHRAAFTLLLSQLAGRELAPEFSEESALKAGVCIMAGSWVLTANLRDELNFFTGTFEHGS